MNSSLLRFTAKLFKQLYFCVTPNFSVFPFQHTTVLLLPHCSRSLPINTLTNDLCVTNFSEEYCISIALQILEVLTTDDYLLLLCIPEFPGNSVRI